jgi:UDP-3-O-[3-hydroxymyristoyl] glucosamine N-acyltransferase
MKYKVEFIREADFSIIGQDRFSSRNSLRYLIDFRYFDPQMSKSAALILNKNINIEKILSIYKGGIIICRDAKECFYAIHEYLYKNTDFFGNKFQSKIDNSTIIGRNTIISQDSVIISKGVILGNNVIIDSNVEIGKNVKIGNGTLLGVNSYRLVTLKGKKMILTHAGKLKIGSNVIIMNNSIISKGITPWYNTIISPNVIIGNGVIIAHGNLIGEATSIIDNSTIAGHCDIGENVWIGPQSVIKNRIKIGNNVHIALGSIIIEDIPDNMQVSGFFAIERLISLKHYRDLKLGKM